MTDHVLDPRIAAFYRDRYDEDARLRRTAHGQLELLRTRELLERFLPASPAVVLDVGGGTGAHARWLAASGYEVTLVDPVEEHVAQAALARGVSAQVGDARGLAQADCTADVVLVLGPLYHLPDAGDRAQAWSEAVRVVRPGGLVAAAAISRYSGLLELAANGGLDDVTLDRVRSVLTSGVHPDDPDGFTTAYFHLPEELLDEARRSGLVETEVFGVKGPSAPALDNLRGEDLPRHLSAAARAARVVETDPRLLVSSPHFLAVGRKPW